MNDLEDLTIPTRELQVATARLRRACDRAEFKGLLAEFETKYADNPKALDVIDSCRSHFGVPRDD